MWAAVRFITLDDTQRRGYMPVRYNGSESSDDVQLQLGRATDWSGPETGPIRGIGHRLLLVGEDAIGPMDLGEVQIAVG